MARCASVGARRLDGGLSLGDPKLVLACAAMLAMAPLAVPKVTMRPPSLVGAAGAASSRTARAA